MVLLFFHYAVKLRIAEGLQCIIFTLECAIFTLECAIFTLECVIFTLECVMFTREYFVFTLELLVTLACSPPFDGCCTVLHRQPLWHFTQCRPIKVL